MHKYSRLHICSSQARSYIMGHRAMAPAVAKIYMFSKLLNTVIYVTYVGIVGIINVLAPPGRKSCLRIWQQSSIKQVSSLLLNMSLLGKWSVNFMFHIVRLQTTNDLGLNRAILVIVELIVCDFEDHCRSGINKIDMHQAAT